MRDLEGKVALVTGASRGIGRAVALRLAREGAAIGINFRTNRAAALETLDAVKNEGVKAMLVPGDVGVAAEVSEIVTHTTEELGGLHIVVNNAGITVDALVMRLHEEDWDRTVDTDLKGAFLVSKACMRPLLKQRWGRIINISSVAGLAGSPGLSAYSAAKAGLIGFTRTVAREVATRGITVNVVAPGWIDTEMTDQYSAEMKDRMIAQVPMGRLGTGDDVASVVCFLAGNGAAYMTGQTLVIDGGMVMP